MKKLLGAALVLCLATLPAGCGRGPVLNMVPSPIVMQDERLDFTLAVAPESRGTSVNVLYATTREPAPPEAPERFTHRPGKEVRLGIAQVQLGEQGWPFEQLAASNRTSRPEAPRPARVAALEEFGARSARGAPDGDAERKFIAAIDRQLERSAHGSVVIYVPGYRATFDQVMVVMGSWGHFLGHDSPVVAFSWPTGTSVWNYLTDCPRARAFEIGRASCRERV